MKTALISVFEKAGIVEFAQELVNLGWQLLASGGTAKALAAASLPVRDVATLVGGGPILGHRVVTLSREVHAGLLARDIDLTELEALGMPRIGLACVDFYPLGMEIARPGSTLESVTELTDIGGPTMLRSAAKGRRLAIGDPADRAMVLQWLRDGTADDPAKLRWLAAKAEYIVARYTLLSASYLGEGEFAGCIGRRIHACLYGENPWQGNAALYSSGTNDPLALERFELVEGEKPSYNNWIDLHRVLATGSHLAAAQQLNLKTVQPFVIGVKHGNPCGAADSHSELLAVEIDGPRQPPSDHGRHRAHEPAGQRPLRTSSGERRPPRRRASADRRHCRSFVHRRRERDPPAQTWQVPDAGQPGAGTPRRTGHHRHGSADSPGPGRLSVAGQLHLRAGLPALRAPLVRKPNG